MATNERIFNIKINGIETSIRNIGEFSDAMSVLNQTSDSTTNRMDDLKGSLDAFNKKSKDNTARVREINKELALLSLETNKDAAAIKKLNVELINLSHSMEVDADAIKDVQDEFKQLNNDLKDTKKQIDTLGTFEEKLKPAVNSLAALEDKAEMLKTQLKEVEIGSIAFKNITTELAKTNNQLKDLEKNFEGLDLEQRLKTFLDFSQGITDTFSRASEAVVAFGGDAKVTQQIIQGIEKINTLINIGRSVSETIVQGKMAFRGLLQKKLTEESKKELTVSEDRNESEEEVNKTLEEQLRLKSEISNISSDGGSGGGDKKGGGVDVKAGEQLKGITGEVGKKLGFVQSTISAIGNGFKTLIAGARAFALAIIANPIGAIAAAVVATGVAIGYVINELGVFNGLADKIYVSFAKIKGFLFGMVTDYVNVWLNVFDVIKNIVTGNFAKVDFNVFKNFGEQAVKQAGEAGLAAQREINIERLELEKEHIAKLTDLENQRIADLLKSNQLTTLDRGKLEQQALQNTKKNNDAELKVLDEKLAAIKAKEVNMATTLNGLKGQLSKEDAEQKKKYEEDIQKFKQNNATLEVDIEKNKTDTALKERERLFNYTKIFLDKEAFLNEDVANKQIKGRLEALKIISNTYGATLKQIQEANNAVTESEKNAAKVAGDARVKAIQAEIGELIQRNNLNLGNREENDARIAQLAADEIKVKKETANTLSDIDKGAKERAQQSTIKFNQEELDRAIKLNEEKANIINSRGETIIENERRLIAEERKSTREIEKAGIALQKQVELTDEMEANARTIAQLEEIRAKRIAEIKEQLKQDLLANQKKVEILKEQLEVIKQQNASSEELLQTKIDAANKILNDKSLIGTEEYKKATQDAIDLTKELTKVKRDNAAVEGKKEDEIQAQVEVGVDLQKGADAKIDKVNKTINKKINDTPFNFKDSITKGLIDALDIPEADQDTFIKGMDKMFNSVSEMFNNSVQLIQQLNQNAIAELDSQIADIDERMAAQQERIDASQKAYEDSLATIENIESGLSNARSSRREELLGQLEGERDKAQTLFKDVKKQQQAEIQLANKKAQLEEEKAKREQENAQIQINIQKAVAIASLATAAVQAYQAITATGALSGPLAPFTIAATVAAMAAGIAAVSAFTAGFTAANGGMITEDGKIQKFATGGLLQGASHSNGGIRGSGRFSNIEVEGGEFVMNKQSTAKYLPTLISMNKFANGGILPNSNELFNNISSSTTNTSNTYNQLDNLNKNTQAYIDRPLQVSIVEINKVQNNVKEIVDKSKL